VLAAAPLLWGEGAALVPTPRGRLGQAVRAIAFGAYRRWKRERRRRLVGRSYDMALELARLIPRRSRVLDVGCGNGFIAHHLSALLGAPVIGLDVADATSARIEYYRYDGAHFPASDRSFDAVVLCYVLHHAREQRSLLREVKRVLRGGGLVVVYEDIPRSRWDRAVCLMHGRRWKRRTGSCTFRTEREWRDVFEEAGLEVLAERGLSRWRNLVHPVRRRLYVLRRAEDRAEESAPATRARRQ